MAGNKNQKLKTLHLIKYIEAQTDADHGVTIEDMTAYLESMGISAERKSLYADIELLRGFGLDIETVRGKRTEYRLMSRLFQLPELKLLVDAVGASRFITRKKSLELIKKLETLTSVQEARELRRSVHVDNRVKSMNESIYYSVDALHQAINNNRMLSFKYFNYTREKARALRRGGQPYVVSPLALTFSDGNYYLYAYDGERGEIRTYRVDRITGAEVLAQERDVPSGLENFDPAAHTNEMFSMYGGRRRPVTLSFADALATVVIDRFGSDTMMIPDGEARFSITVEVMVSPVFLGWIFGFGPDARIMAPDDVIAEYLAMTRDACRQYSENFNTE